MKLLNLLWAGIFTCIVFVGASEAAMVHTIDFINDVDRTNFMGFESLPDTGNFGPNAYEPGTASDRIHVEQVDGIVTGIWTSYISWGAEGSRSWYPNGGDLGFTQIMRADGSEFSNIGLLASDGGTLREWLEFELRNDGVLVLSGVLPISSNGPAYYIGFEGGGFDEVNLRSGLNEYPGDFYNDARNGLVIDSIELSSVPIPTSILLLGTGINAVRLEK